MPIYARWDNESTKQVIYLEYEGIWTWAQYDAAISRTGELFDEVVHPVSVIVDLERSKSIPVTSNAISKGYKAIQLWQSKPNYADSWFVVSPGYWVRIALWAFANAYNPFNMEIVTTVDEARQKAYDLSYDAQP